jgi:beta-glucosidase
VLPLKTSGIKIAVVGPLADQTKVLLGNYTGTPTRTVSVLEGLKEEFPEATINYVQGTQFLSKEASPVPSALLTTDGKQGIKANYSRLDLTASVAPKATPPAPLLTRVEPNIDLSSAPLPIEVAGVKPLAIQWETTLTPPETGDYNIGMAANGFFRVSVDGKPIASDWQSSSTDPKLGRVHLEAGKPVKLEIGYGASETGIPEARLVWAKVNLKTSPESIAAAKAADVVVAVVGITSELEGEEMPVNEEGFKGGDRTSIDLPKPEQELLEAMAATRKPLVVVLTNGSALGVNWAQQHANAILEAWYPGEEGGTAVAQTLSGRNNPGGRLPVTFYKSVDQLPPFEDYSMKGRTYRYFNGTPLYPFGYGLSYTTFSYKGLTVPTTPVAAGSPVVAEVTVTNSGRRAGDEVAQLYLSFPSVPGAPLRALRAFQRVHLEPGASQKLRFELKDRDLSMVTDAGDPIIAEGQYSISVGSGQPSSGVPVLTKDFDIKGKLTLPE